MTGKREDCESVLGGDTWAAETCEALDKRSKAQHEAQQRALRAIDAADDSLDIARGATTYDARALVTMSHEDRVAASDLREVDDAEDDLLDGLAGEIGRELMADGRPASEAHAFAQMTKGIGAAMRYSLSRLRGDRLPKVLGSLIAAQARREPRPTGPRPVFRSSGWQTTDADGFIKTGYGKRAEVRPQAFGGKWLLVLTDWTNGRPVRQRLLDHLSMTFESRDAALSAGDSWLVLDEGQGGSDTITETEAAIMTARCAPDEITNRVNWEVRDMGKLAEGFKRQQAALDKVRQRIVPAAADESGRMRRGSLVARDEPSLVMRGHASEGVDTSTGKRSVVFSVTDLVRRSVGLAPRRAPAMVERNAMQAVAIQDAYAGAGPELRPLQPPGIYDRALDCYWQTPEAMARAHATLDMADGCQPHHDYAAMAHTRGGSVAGLGGTQQVAESQRAQRGMPHNEG